MQEVERETLWVFIVPLSIAMVSKISELIVFLFRVEYSSDKV